MPIHNTWLLHGSANHVIEYAIALPEADGLGFVYVLSLSNDTRKLGCSTNLHQRLLAHQTEMSRYGVEIQFCSITRPHFNFRAVERNALRWLNSVTAKEILSDPHERVCEAVPGRARSREAAMHERQMLGMQTAGARVRPFGWSLQDRRPPALSPRLGVLQPSLPGHLPHALRAATGDRGTRGDAHG